MPPPPPQSTPSGARASERRAAAAEAGRRGADVRSDCWVRITLRESGGINLDLRSKVESMYGDAIRGQVQDVLSVLGVRDAQVELEDAGALPFVIAARLEAAIRRLGLDVGEGCPPGWGPGTQHQTTRDRFRRSRLYLPGNEPKFMLNAGLHEPDGVILDLEDSVAAAEKDAARVLVRNALRSVDFKGCERMVRINQGALGLQDAAFLAAHNVHVMLIPKVEDPEQVRAVERAVAGIGQRGSGSGDRGSGCGEQGSGIGDRGADVGNRQSTIDNRQSPVWLMPIVESALGVLRAYEIATASPNVCALTIGLEDYTADIGTARTAEGRESFWARSQVVNAARAAGVQPIDSVFSDVADSDALRAGVLEAKALGFDGKGCIHPRQIRVIHEAFAPSEQELDKAGRIVAAYEQAQANGLGVVSLGTKMIDPPVVKRAQRVVRLAALAGMSAETTLEEAQTE